MPVHVSVRPKQQSTKPLSCVSHSRNTPELRLGETHPVRLRPAVLVACMQVALDGSRPHTAASMRRIDAGMSGALEAFDYLPESPLGEPPFEENFTSFFRNKLKIFCL